MSDGSMDIDAQRKLAAHEVEIANMKKTQDDMTEQLRTINTTLSRINQTLSEARGGWKMLLLVGGAGGAIGATIGHLLRTVR